MGAKNTNTGQRPHTSPDGATLWQRSQEFIPGLELCCRSSLELLKMFAAAMVSVSTAPRSILRVNYPDERVQLMFSRPEKSQRMCSTNCSANKPVVVGSSAPLTGFFFVCFARVFCLCCCVFYGANDPLFLPTSQLLEGRKQTCSLATANPRFYSVHIRTDKEGAGFSCPLICWIEGIEMSLMRRCCEEQHC